MDKIIKSQPRPVPGPDCKGDGRMNKHLDRHFTNRCPSCNGTGFEPIYKKPDTTAFESREQTRIEVIFKEIEDYIINSRRMAKKKREHQKQIKPKDINSQILIGGKMKSLQNVLNKVQTLKDRELKQGSKS